ncbi:MAG TPA: succinate dehydrogenase assembly factor 2 [Chromatiaceae bacterium]|nr:succinate dehydrogenase assembly factor 2 [Chromatiaceae bacterium]
MTKQPYKEKERLRWQCRRGMLELDCLFERFLRELYDDQTAEIQKAFRQLLREADPHLFRWLVNEPQDTPERYRALLELIRT